MRVALRHAAHWERLLAEHIPYSAQVSDTLVRTVQGDYVQTFRLAGAPFESADDRELNDWHERLNVLWRNIASPHVALWTHLIRRRGTAYPGDECPSGFAAELNRKYRERLQHETLMVNDLYLSLIFRPARDRTNALTLRCVAARRSGCGSDSAGRGH